MHVRGRGFALSEAVSRVFNPLGKKSTRLVAILSSLILITLITPTQAVDYNSGWDVADSGTEVDLFTSAYDGESVFAFGAGGVILQSADKGATWVQLDSPATTDLHASDSVEGAIAVVGEGGAAFLRAAGSDTWMDISLNPPVDFRGMAMTSATSLVAVGPEGVVWQYSSDAWMQRDSGVVTDLNDVSFLDSTLGMIVGDSGTILATNDGGESWEYREAPEGLVADIVALDYYSNIRVYAVTDVGNILKSVGTTTGTAAGYVWELVEIESAGRATSLGLELSSIDVSSVNKLLVSGPSSYVALSLDGGNIITSQMNPLPSVKDFNHVLFLNLFDAVIVGADGVILFSENAGEDEAIGFQVIDYGDFGQFVDYSKGMLIDGLFATIRIVLFGIFLGFFLGVILSMMKTAPTTLKDVAQLDRYSIIRIILIPLCIIEAAIPFIRLNEKSWSANKSSREVAYSVRHFYETAQHPSPEGTGIGDAVLRDFADFRFSSDSLGPKSGWLGIHLRANRPHISGWYQWRVIFRELFPSPTWYCVDPVGPTVPDLEEILPQERGAPAVPRHHAKVEFLGSEAVERCRNRIHRPLSQYSTDCSVHVHTLRGAVWQVVGRSGCGNPRG